jgi:hypothetical protein
MDDFQDQRHARSGYHYRRRIDWVSLQVNGEFVDLTFIRRPYADPAGFGEFLEVLAAVTGNPHDLWRNLASAKVQLIPDELSERDSREVMSELSGQPPPTIASDSNPR